MTPELIRFRIWLRERDRRQRAMLQAYKIALRWEALSAPLDDDE